LGYGPGPLVRGNISGVKVWDCISGIAPFVEEMCKCALPEATPQV
jgi:hypothetical protein